MSIPVREAAGKIPRKVWTGRGWSGRISAQSLAPPAPGLLGAFTWAISWDLNRKSDPDKGGYVVQHLIVKFDIQDRNGKSVKHALQDTVKWDYWEIWRVRPGFQKAVGGNVSTLIAQLRKSYLAQSNNKNLSKADRQSYLTLAKGLFPTYNILSKDTTLVNDIYGISSAPDFTEGSITFAGFAHYLDGVTPNDVPEEFQPGNANGTGSGKLLSTTDPAAVNALNAKASSISNYVPHYIIVTWDATNANNVADRFTRIEEHNP